MENTNMPVKRRIINIQNISFLLAIIGIIVGIWEYLASIEKPELSYYSHPLRTKILRASNLGALKVEYNGNEIKGDITATQIMIWNGGKAPISRNDILENVAILYPEKINILEAKVVEAIRGVSGFRVIGKIENKNAIVLDWRILETNDGAIVQVIFEGDPNAVFSVAGSVIGQDSPVNKSQIKRESMSISRTKMMTVLIVSAILFTILFPAVYFLIKNIRKIDLKREYCSFLSIIILLAFFVLLLFIIYISIKSFASFAGLSPFD